MHSFPLSLTYFESHFSSVYSQPGTDESPQPSINTAALSPSPPTFQTTFRGNQTAQIVPADPSPGVSEHGTLRVGRAMKSISAHRR